MSSEGDTVQDSPDGGGASRKTPQRGAGSAWGAPCVAFAAALLLYGLVPWIRFDGAWGIVNYDDPFLTSADNPAIADGLLGGMKRLLPPWGEPFMHAWLPLYYGSLGFDHALFGEPGFAWHLHSAALWGLAAALLVTTARRLGLRGAAPLSAGVVLAVHPASVESVAWLASRKEQLSLVWGLVAAALYLGPVDVAGGRRGRPWWAAAALSIALLAKASALVVPLLLGAHALLTRPGTKADRLRPVLPCLAVATALGAVHVLVARGSGTVGSGTGAGLFDLFVADLDVVWRSVRTLFVPWPGWLSVEHDVRPWDVHPGRVSLGVLVVIAWALLVWRSRRRPLAVLALVAVPLAAAPFNNVLPRTSVLFAERYLTFPLACFALGVGAAAARRLGRVAPFALACVLGVLSTMRIGAWHDSVSLWTEAERAEPGSALVQIQLADAYTRAAGEAAGSEASNRLVRAERALRRARERVRDEIAALESSGDDVPSLLLLRRVQAESRLSGHLLLTAGGDRREAAAERLREAIAVIDGAVDALAEVEDASGGDERLHLLVTNRAAAHEALGELDKALADWRLASRTDPSAWQPLNAIARIHAMRGAPHAADDALVRSASVAPHDPAAARERARIRLATGGVAGAKQELVVALRRNEDDVGLLVAVARLDVLLMRPAAAEVNFRKALEHEPGNQPLREELAGALIQQAQAAAARDDVEAAQRAAHAAADVVPGSSAPDQILGIIARRRGDLDVALQRFRAARALQPTGRRINEGLASVLTEIAAELLEEGREGRAVLHMEEAVGLGVEVLSTSAMQLRYGVSGWPVRDPGASTERVVARNAGLAGLAWLATGRPDRARRELRVAAAGARRSDSALAVPVVQLLARAEMLAGDDAAALEVAKTFEAVGEAAGLPPGEMLDAEVALLVEVGIVRRGRGALDEAEEAFGRTEALLERVADSGGSAARVRQRRGEVKFAREDFMDATLLFDEAIELDPHDPEPLLNRAAVWRSLFAVEEDMSYLRAAEQDLRMALATAPSDGRVMAALGETLLMANRPSEAFPWLSRAVLADPSRTTARAQLASLLARAGRSNLERYKDTQDDEALEAADGAARRAVALGARDHGPLLLLSDVLREQGDWRGAQETLEQAARQHPDRSAVRDALASFFRDLGHLHLLRRDESAALDAFRRAMDVEDTVDADLRAVPDRLHGIAVSAFQRGVEARRRGDVEAALDAFRMSVRAEETPEGWYQCASALLATAGDDGDALREAEDACARAAAMRPEMFDVRILAADVLMRLGRPGDAADQLRAWLDAAPDDHEMREAVSERVRAADELEDEIRREVEQRVPREDDDPDAPRDPEEHGE